MRALAPEVRVFLKVRVENFQSSQFQFRLRLQKEADFGLQVTKSVPQRLKPRIAYDVYGTAEAVPFVERLSPNQLLQSTRECMADHQP